jgi:hypothetical protein
MEFATVYTFRGKNRITKANVFIKQTRHLFTRDVRQNGPSIQVCQRENFDNAIFNGMILNMAIGFNLGWNAGMNAVKKQLVK